MIHAHSTNTRFFGGGIDDAAPAWQTSGTIPSVPGYSNFAQTFVATSPFSAPVALSVVGALPSGFVLSGDTVTALLSNPPEGQTATYTFTLRAATGILTSDRTFTLVVTHATASDPYADKVKFLYNLNGDYTDRSLQRDLTALNTSANAGVSTTQVKFGSHSLYFAGSPGGAVDIRVPASPDLLIPANTDFCFEFWMRASAPQPYGCMMVSAAAASGSGTASEIANGINIGNWTGTDGSSASGTARTSLSVFLPGIQLYSTTNPNDDAWHHVAVVRNAGTARLYFDGIAQGPALSFTGAVDFGQQYGFLIGRYINLAINNIYIGYYDDIRLTVGVPRYVANFAPPTIESAYP